ncbi:MAG TPA: type II toxin-antitoxin system prevent-host-death family antitoxin [Azospirillaceae bacterium]|nr:type II toxin-antitoxin system prevent-host-death family antitoxin [Azospirillaceae bacterium]
MKTVSAREANQRFSQLLAEAQDGEHIVITKHDRPVAVLRPYSQEAEDLRRAAVDELVAFMKTGVTTGLGPTRISRDEMHER